jgi:hypothetical protein
MHHAEGSSLGTTEEDMAPAMAAFAAYADDLSAAGAQRRSGRCSSPRDRRDFGSRHRRVSEKTFAMGEYLTRS